MEDLAAAASFELAQALDQKSFKKIRKIFLGCR